MKIFTSATEVAAAARVSTKRKVLVPTMGALHAGHASLLRRAREIAGRYGEVQVSIFVNPLQFAPGSDFEKYPRPDAADEALCRDAGVDILFRPAVEEMYPGEPSVFVEETALASSLCGRSRPGHFRGVCTVVTKLFHLLAPDFAIFGEKDFQQLAIIRRLVRDLQFQIEIVAAPTVRETDGLACSSRNAYLSVAERAQAPVLPGALLAAKAAFLLGETSAARLLARVRDSINAAPLARIDYAELVDAETLQPVATAKSHSLLAVAVFFGQTRLIDNLLFP